MVSYRVMVLIGVKIIFNREIAFLWWVRVKPKVLSNIFLFGWSCFLLWNDPGEILSTDYYHCFMMKIEFSWAYQIQLGVLRDCGLPNVSLMETSLKESTLKFTPQLTPKYTQNYLIFKSTFSTFVYSSSRCKRRNASYWTFEAVHMQNS